jgi:hypothetical protein
MNWWLTDVFEGEYRVLEFEVAAWGERFERFVDHVPGVFEAGEESPPVNVVEPLGEVPFVFYVIDLEMAVWRDTVLIVSGVFARLVWGEY